MKPIIDYADSAKIIKDRVTMDDIVGGYFPDPPPRYKRIPCPLHGGHDRNFSYNTHYYKCFVCGASGDIFKLVMEYFKIDFREAVTKLNHDFHVGLELDSPTAEVAQAVREAAERAAALRAKRDADLAEAEEAYHAALDRFIELDKAIMHNPIESEVYASALIGIERAKYNLEVEEMRLARIKQLYNC